MDKFTQFIGISLSFKQIGLAIVLIGFSATQAQPMPTRGIFASHPTQKKNASKFISLKEGLELLMKETDMGIIYEPEIIKGIRVNEAAIAAHNYSLQEVLHVWLKDSPLTFSKLPNSQNYIIMRKAEQHEILSVLEQDVETGEDRAGRSTDLKPVSQLLVSQERVVTGRVTSSEDGKAISGVSITVPGNDGGAVTDASGGYRIAIPDGADRLMFNAMGFERQEEVIGNRRVINVELVAVTAHLEEVVVNALGFERKADALGYSTSQIGGNQLSNAVEGAVINGMAGKASGVRITRSSGDPGAGSHIQIRGASTIGGIQPLIVLDGIPIDNSSSGNSNGGVYQQSRLNDINPDDIESMDILKGAAAAALWGSRASNGVIVVTTKKGKANEKLNISFKSSYSYDQILNRHPLQSAFGQGDNGIYSQTSLRSWGDLIADRFGGPDVIDDTGPFFRAVNGNIYYPILEKRNQTIYHDSNFDQVIRNGYFLDNSLSLSGGDSRSTYFVSLSDFKQDGIIQNSSDYRRTTFRVNSSRKFGDKITLSTNTTYALSSNNRIRKGNASSGLYLGLLRTPPDFNILDYEGEYYSSAGAAPLRHRHRVYRNPLGANANPGFNNPLWTINNQENFSKVNRFITSMQLNAKPSDWMELVLRSGIDTYTDERNAYFATGSAGAIQSTGVYEDAKETDFEFNTDLMSVFRPKFHELLNAEMLVGFNFNQRSNQDVWGQIQGFIDPAADIRNFINGPRGNFDMSNSRTLRRNAALYGSVDLSYNNYLFLVLTGRFESASTFGELSKSSFFFPSATVAWQFHRNVALPEAISFGKLRASFAMVGVEPAMYRTISQYVAASYSDANGGSLDGSRFGNGAFVPANRVGNPYLRPEIKTEFETGLDMRFHSDRLRTSFTYYNNQTTDVLFDVPIPSSTGYTNMQDNAGEIKNWGVEVDVNYDVFAKRDFTWTVGVLWDRNRNVISKLPDAESLDLGGLSGISGRAVQGYQLGALWGSRWLRDAANSLVLNENGFPQLDESQGVIGDPNPTWRGSALTTLRYKNIALDVVIETMQGNHIFAGTYASLLDYGLAPESAHISVAPRDLLTYNGQVIPQGTEFRGNIADFGAGDVALDQSWYRTGGGYASGAAESFIQDGSWIRIQQLTFSYALNSERFRTKTRLQGIELSLTGRNLFVWAKEFRGNDPNTNLMGVSSVRGIDYFNTPGTRSYVLTLKVNY